jgi:hypothetical protein
LNTRTLWALLVGAGVLAALPARADIYTWVDASGVTNVSNLPPPEKAEGVRVVRAAPRDPAREAARLDAAREAETRALNERVQQLQADVERVRRETAEAQMFVAQPPMQYAQAQPAPYVIVVTPPAPAYPEAPGGCGSAWGDCMAGFWPGFYPSSVVVLRDRHFRHGRHPHPHAPAHRHARHHGRDTSAFLPPLHVPAFARTGPWRK